MPPVIEMKYRPLVAEIVGPSGAGKSTVSAFLNSNGASARAGITIWGLPTASLVTSGLISLPDLARLSFERRSVRRDELKQAIRLTAFRRLLGRYIDGNKDRHYSALFMDEGVVFALAKLRADIGIEFASERLKRWEQKMLDRWSKMLDVVIWLDAPDAVLTQRIRSREKLHRMKDEPDHRVNDFLKNYRAAYESVVSELIRRGNVRVLRLNTENFDPAGISEEILRFTGAEITPG